MVIASVKLRRRCLAVMNLLAAFGCFPLAVFGLTDQIWVMAIAAFMVGAAFNGGVAIWRTLTAAPGSGGNAAGESLGLPVVFLIAGVTPLVIEAVAIIARG